MLALQGIDLEGFRAKDIAEFSGQDFDYLITVCAGAAEDCPVSPGVRKCIPGSLPDLAAVEGSDPAKLAAFEERVLGMRRCLSLFTEAAPGSQVDATGRG